MKAYSINARANIYILFTLIRRQSFSQRLKEETISQQIEKNTKILFKFILRQSFSQCLKEETILQRIEKKYQKCIQIYSETKFQPLVGQYNFLTTGFIINLKLIQMLNDIN